VIWRGGAIRKSRLPESWLSRGAVLGDFERVLLRKGAQAGVPVPLEAMRGTVDVCGYSQRRETMGSMRAARRAGM